MSKETQEQVSTTSQSPKKERELDCEAAVALTEDSSKNMDDDATAATTAAATVDTGPKKRSARNQITKDDYDREDASDDNDEVVIKQGFKRAPTEVLKKRKIYKVNRTVGPKTSDTSSETTSTSTKTNTSKSKADDADETTKKKSPASTSSANPFAATSLVAEKTSDNGEGETTKSPFASAFSASDGSNKTASSSGKVFGFGSGGYSGFGSAKSTTSGGGGGFAGIGSSLNNGKPSGFGVSTETSKSWFGGGEEGAATNDASDGNSLFGKATSSPLKFNFKCSNEATIEKNDNTAATQLPLNVQLTTGEEDEMVIYTERCKSWVLQNEDETETPVRVNDATDGKANPSVKPSTEFQATILSSKTGKDDETAGTQTTKAKNDTDKDLTKNTNENGGDEEAKCKEEVITSGKDKISEGETPEHHRWQELGVGPMKILRSVTKPDRLRLVQRRESSKNGPATKVILNVPLWKESACTRDWQDQQYSRLKTFENGKVCTYLFKFRENNQAGYFQYHVFDNISQAREFFAKSVE